MKYRRRGVRKRRRENSEFISTRLSWFDSHSCERFLSSPEKSRPFMACTRTFHRSAPQRPIHNFRRQFSEAHSTETWDSQVIPLGTKIVVMWHFMFTRGWRWYRVLVGCDALGFVGSSVSEWNTASIFTCHIPVIFIVATVRTPNLANCFSSSSSSVWTTNHKTIFMFEWVMAKYLLYCDLRGQCVRLLLFNLLSLVYLNSTSDVRLVWLL